MNKEDKMTVEITNEEKITIVEQHMKNLNYNKYNLNVTLLELNALASPDQTSIDNILLQISEIDAKLSVLEQEKTSLE